MLNQPPAIPDSSAPISVPPSSAPDRDDIADHVEQLISSGLDERAMRQVLARTSLTETERKIVVREVLQARAFVDTEDAHRRAGWS